MQFNKNKIKFIPTFKETCNGKMLKLQRENVTVQNLQVWLQKQTQNCFYSHISDKNIHMAMFVHHWVIEHHGLCCNLDFIYLKKQIYSQPTCLCFGEREILFFL